MLYVSAVTEGQRAMALFCLKHVRFSFDNDGILSRQPGGGADGEWCVGIPDRPTSHRLITIMTGSSKSVIGHDDCDDDYMSTCASGGLFRRGSKHRLTGISRPLLSLIRTRLSWCSMHMLPLKAAPISILLKQENSREDQPVRESILQIRGGCLPHTAVLWKLWFLDYLHERVAYCTFKWCTTVSSTGSKRFIILNYSGRCSTAWGC